MEEMIVDGLFQGLVDLAPAGLAEAILGGPYAGMERLTGELSTSLPIVMTLCGFDMFSCGPYERRLTDPIWKKRKLEKRKLYFQDEMRIQHARRSRNWHYCKGLRREAEHGKSHGISFYPSARLLFIEC